MRTVSFHTFNRFRAYFTNLPGKAGTQNGRGVVPKNTSIRKLMFFGPRSNVVLCFLILTTTIRAPRTKNAAWMCRSEKE